MSKDRCSTVVMGHQCTRKENHADDCRFAGFVPPSQRKTDAETGYPLQEQIAKADKRNTARRERNKAMQDMGLTRVKGALGGIYWE